MKQTFFLFLVCLFGTISAQAFLSANRWTDFSGKLSKTNINMSLYLGEKGQITGNYCYAKYDQRIPITGQLNGMELVLYEMKNSKQVAIFKGTLLNDSTSHFKGTWQTETQTLPFDVHMTASAGGTPTKRYMDTKQSDAQVEAYMKKVKTAVLAGNKEWLSTQVTYPYTVYTAEGKTKALKNKQEFLNNYALVVSAGLKQRMADICVCNLFSNYRGIMLGNGEVWINERPGGKGIFYVSGLMP